MKTITHYLPLLLIAALATSLGCSDFLDKEPLGDLSSATFYETEQDAVLATNAIYNANRAWFITGGYPILDILSDDMTKGSNPTDGSFLIEVDSFRFSPDQGQIQQMYAALYVGVLRANLVLNRVPSIPMDNDLKTRLLAEAHFLRAYFYFKLVRAFGGVPMVTSEDPPRQLERTPADEIYNEIIIPDLEFAAANLPEKSAYGEADLGRATRGAALGLLAKVYLFREDYENTERLALEVINSGEYSLDPNFDNVHSATNVFGSGSLFEIGAITEEFSDGGNQYGQTQGVRGSPSKGWGFGRPTYDLITFFEANDPRLDASVVFLGDTIAGEVILGDAGTPDTIYTDAAQTQIEQIETYNQKVYMPGDIPDVQFGHNRLLLRYADVLLMAAEALNENGKPAQALEYLNQVRARARGEATDVLPDITTTDQAALRQAIWDERRAELALEEHRYFDLVRTGQAATVLAPLGFEPNKHELLPIPQGEIDISEGTLEQNPGY